MTKIARAVRAAAGRELETILADLESWVNHDSPSGDRKALDELATVLARSFASYGLAPKLVPGEAGIHVHARVNGVGRSRIALLCHHDTVFPRGEAARRPFRRVDDRVLGPGVADMKGGIVVALHAVRLLAARSSRFARLEIVSVPDEETRSAPFATLERLQGYDAALCMECGRPGGAVVSQRKGGLWLTVRAVGQPAHAGVSPEEGRNAIVALCREALRISALSEGETGLTVELTRIRGGEYNNSVPGEASLDVDLRAPSAAALERAAAMVGSFEDHRGVEMALLQAPATPPLERTAAVAGLAGAAKRLGEALGEAIPEAATGGASDGCWTAAAGIPTLDGLGPVGALDHTPAEYAEVGSFASRCGLVAGLIVAIEDIHAGSSAEPSRGS